MPKVNRMGYFIVNDDWEQIHGFGRYASLHDACEDAFEYLLLSRHYPDQMPTRILVLGIEAFSYVQDKPAHVLMILEPGTELQGHRDDA